VTQSLADCKASAVFWITVGSELMVCLGTDAQEINKKSAVMKIKRFMVASGGG